MPKRIKDAPEEYSDYEHALASQIGGRILSSRHALFLTQGQVRELMATQNALVTRARFSRLERGEYLPNAAQIIALAKVLNVSYLWLLEGIEQSQ